MVAIKIIIKHIWLCFIFFKRDNFKVISLKYKLKQCVLWNVNGYTRFVLQQFSPIIMWVQQNETLFQSTVT